jgi:hypothetical protein
VEEGFGVVAFDYGEDAPVPDSELRRVLRMEEEMEVRVGWSIGGALHRKVELTEGERRRRRHLRFSVNPVVLR